MKKILKRSLALALVICMAVGILPAVAHAEVINVSKEYPPCAVDGAVSQSVPADLTLDTETNTLILDISVPAGMRFVECSGTHVLTYYGENDEVLYSYAFTRDSVDPLHMTAEVGADFATTVLHDARIKSHEIGGGRAYFATVYTLEISNGSASVNTTYDKGTKVTLPATLDSAVTVPTGYKFAGWEDSAKNEIFKAGATISVNKNYSLQPKFVEESGEEYQAMFIVDGSLSTFMTSKDHWVTMPEGRFMEGYSFWGWVTDWLDAFDAEDEVLLTDDTVFYGVYDYVSYDVKLSSDSQHVTVTGLPTKEKYLDDCKFTVKADEGYEIETVSASYWRGNVPVSRISEDQYVLSMPSGDVEVKVTVKPVAPDAPVSHEVRFVVDGMLYDIVHVEHDTAPAMPAAPVKQDASFLGWKAADETVYADTLPAIQAYTVFTAVFKEAEPASYAITASATNAAVSGQPETAVSGTQVIFTTAADEGCLITAVYAVNETTGEYITLNTTATNTTEGATYFFTMPAAPVSIKAEAGMDDFDVVYLDGNGAFVGGEKVAFMGTANVAAFRDKITTGKSGYHFAGWVSEDTKTPVTEPSLNSADFVIVRKTYVNAFYEMDVHRTFAPVKKIALNLNYDAKMGKVSATPSADLHKGDRIAICAQPAEGYRVKEMIALNEANETVPMTFVEETEAFAQHWSIIMPDENVTVIVLFVERKVSDFKDVNSGDWFYDAVRFVTARGYFVGVAEDRFAPDMLMNRGMFVTVLGRVAGVNPESYSADSGFTDVDASAYYAPYVTWAKENGIVLGRGNGTFDPTAFITRQEMAVIMQRFCTCMGYAPAQGNKIPTDGYSDMDTCADWARDAVEWAIGAGLIRGKSQTAIVPLANATRAEVAQIIKNLNDSVNF